MHDLSKIINTVKMTQTNIWEQAKTGDTVAIETILNELLHSQSVTVKVGLKHNCLYIVLAAASVPKQEELIKLIRQQIVDLSIEKIQHVKIYAAIWGQEGQAWHDEFSLNNLNSDISVEVQESNIHHPEILKFPSPNYPHNCPSSQQEFDIEMDVWEGETTVTPAQNENWVDDFSVDTPIDSRWDDDVKLETFLQVGSCVLQLDSPQGLLVETREAGKNISEVKFQPRPIVVQSSPLALLYLIGRVDELKQGIGGLQVGQSLEFFGDSGLGKTAIIRHLSYCLDLHTLGKDGVFSFYRRYQPGEDILQAIFDLFYETKFNYKPTPAEIIAALADKEVVIIIDGNQQIDSEINDFQRQLPHSRLILASGNQRLHGNAVSIELRELSLSEVRTFVTQELQRTLSTQEAIALEKLINPSPELGLCPITRNPWLIKLLTWLVDHHDYSFAQLQTQLSLSPQHPDITLVQIALQQLTPQEYRIVEVLAAIGGVGILTPQIQGLTGIKDTEKYLGKLVTSCLVQNESDRYRVPNYFANLIHQIENSKPLEEQSLETIRVKSLNFFGDWIKRYKTLPDFIISEVDAIMELLTWGINRCRWQEVLNITLLLEPSLIRTKQWGLWRIILDYTIEAARHLKDQKNWALALHQQGTRYLCLGEYQSAQTCLQQALEIRQTIQDTGGVAATRVNLNQIPVSETAISTPEKKIPTKTVVKQIQNHPNPYLSLPMWLLRGGFLGVSGLIGYLAWSNLTQMETTQEVKPSPPGVLSPQSQPLKTQKSQLSLSRKQIDFGTVTMEDEQPEQNLTIRNYGSSPIRIGKIEKTAKNSDFELNLQSCTNIVPSNGRCSISISFKPVKDGKHGGKIRILDNQNQTIETISLQGIAEKSLSSPEISSPPPLTIMIEEPLPSPPDTPIPTRRTKIPQPQLPVFSPPTDTNPLTPPTITPEATEIPETPTPQPTPIATPEFTPLPPQFVPPTPQPPTSSLPLPTVTPESMPIPAFTIKSIPSQVENN